MKTRWSAAASLAHSLLTLMIGLLLGLGILVVGIAVFDSFGDHTRIVEAEQTVSTEDLKSLPDGVYVKNPVRVGVIIRNPTTQQVLMDQSRRFMMWILTIATLWILRNLIHSVHGEEPFSRANVSRLRKLGLILLVGWPSAEILHNVITAGLASMSTVGELGSNWNIPPAPQAMFAGLIVFILAEVFAHGLRLREDVEGTV